MHTAQVHNIFNCSVYINTFICAAIVIFSKDAILYLNNGDDALSFF